MFCIAKLKIGHLIIVRRTSYVYRETHCIHYCFVLHTAAAFLVSYGYTAYCKQKLDLQTCYVKCMGLIM